MKSTALSALNNNLLSVSNVTQFLVVNPAISCKNPVVLAIVNRAAQRCRHWFGQEADVNFERKFALLLTDYIASLPTLVAEFNSLCERNGWLNIAHQTNQIIVSSEPSGSSHVTKFPQRRNEPLSPPARR